jgi:hypothetical protein
MGKSDRKYGPRVLIAGCALVVASSGAWSSARADEDPAPLAGKAKTPPPEQTPAIDERLKQRLDQALAKALEKMQAPAGKVLARSGSPSFKEGGVGINTDAGSQTAMGGMGSLGAGIRARRFAEGSEGPRTHGCFLIDESGTKDPGAGGAGGSAAATSTVSGSSRETCDLRRV